MNGGDLNLRNDDLLDKLDSSPREDVDKLIKLGKTLNKNNVGTIIRDSLNAIEENIFNLNSLNENYYDNYSTSNISKTTTSDFKEDLQKAVFTKLSDNLDNKASNFIGHIEKLYKLLFIPYSKELLIKNKLGYNSNNNTTDEYVNNRVLGRILYNIHYFRRYTKIYVKGEFRSIISKIKDSLSNKNYLGTDLYKKIETYVNILYNNNEDLNDDSLINWNIGQTIFEKDTKAETKYNKIIKTTLENEKLIITQYMIDTVFIELIRVIQGELNAGVSDPKYKTTTVDSIKLILLARIKKKILKSGNLLVTPIVAAAVAADETFINGNVDRANTDSTVIHTTESNIIRGEDESLVRILVPGAPGAPGAHVKIEEQELLNYQKDVLTRVAVALVRPPAAVPTPVSRSDKTELVKTIIVVLKNNGIVITDINTHLYKIINKEFYTDTIIHQLLIEIIYKLYDLIDQDFSISEIKKNELEDRTNNLKGNEELVNPKVKDKTKKVVKSVIRLIMDPIHNDAKEIEIDNVENLKTRKALRLIAYIAAYDIIKNPPSNFDTVNRNVLVKKITNNMRLILESESDSTALDYTINAICLHLYIYKEFETKGMFFALEVYYGIIYGSTLRYDLKMLKENEYIIERLEQLDKTYSIIKSIVTDDTFRTLKKMYYKKYPGILNIFRIDTKELTIIKPVKENTTIINNIKEDYTSQEEYRLKDLVILDIKNGGNVNVEEFKKNLKIIYSKKDYQTVFNICNLTNYCIILANQFENCIVDNNIDVIMCEKIYDSFKTTFDDLNAEIKKMKGDNSVINNKLKAEITSTTLDKLSVTLTKLNKEFPTGIKAATAAGAAGAARAATPAPAGTTSGKLSISTANVSASPGGPGGPGPVGPVGVPPRSSLTVNTTNVKIVGGSVEDITELTRIFNELIKAVKKTIDNDNDNDKDNDKDDGASAASDSSTGNKRIKKPDNPTTKPTSDTDTLVKQLKQILSMEDAPTTDILDLFNNYKKDKKLGGGYENRVIDFPVSQVNTNCSLLPIELKTPDEYANLIKGGDSDEVAKKRDELKKTLENINFEDDITESVSDNAKRKVTELTADFQEFIEKPVNIEQDETKLLDDEYIDVLDKFNINEIKTTNYQELRKNLYRIKSSEYFEDIKITNEDIYTFIATTYILRVISLYIVLWFIQIEIIKDVESVIVCYILTYILLFILVYTFVNLSDNKLDTTKSYLYYFYSRVNFSYTRFIVHLGLLFLLIIIPFIIRTVDKESSTYKNITDIEKRYLYTFITNMSTIIWIILSIIAFFFK